MDEPNKQTCGALAATSVDADFLDGLCNARLSQQEVLAFASLSPELIAFIMLVMQESFASSCPLLGKQTLTSVIPRYDSPNSKS